MTEGNPEARCFSDGNETGTPAPRVILDGGTERGEVLLASIARCLADLAAGQILEVVSGDRDAWTDVPVWCRTWGHELIQARTADQSAVLHIRKAVS